MNTKNLLIASAIGAVVTTALANIPIISLLNCLVCLPFWGGPLLATWIYKNQTGTMTMNHAIGVGTVSGLFAGVLGFILNLVVGPATSAAFASQLQQYMPAGSVPPEMFSAGTSVLFLLVGVVITILFGVIGGLIGGAIFKDKPAATPPSTTL
jgi:hypothetical protein